MSWRRLATGLGIVALATAIFASPVQAHAELIDSTPAPDSVLEQSPDAIVLTFSEAVDIVDDSIRLVDPAGEAVDVGPVRRDGGDHTVAVDLDAELTGSYVVGWHVVSADAHPIRGAFTFAVGQITNTDPTLVENVLAEGGDDSGFDGWRGVGRWLSYGGIAILVGGFAILAVCAPTLLAAQRARLLLGLGANAAAIGTLVMLGAQSAILGDGPLDSDGWVAVMESRAGRWWFIRLLLLVMAPLVLAAARRVLDRRPFIVGASVYSLVLLCVVAAGGHAVTGRDVTVGFFATLIHLAAMSIWVGGIVAIVVVVGRPDLWHVAARFSPIALGSVVALAITGVINAWRQLDRFASITDTSYGRWLILKVVLVAVVVAAAAVSRWQLRQRTVVAPVLAASTVGAASAETPPEETRGLRRSVTVELLGMAAVLVATVGLVNSPPPRAAAAEQAAEPVTVTATQGNWEAEVNLVPAQTGGTTMHVFLFPLDGSQDVADEITVTATLPAEDLGPIEIPTVYIPPNHATTDDADFPVAGTWDITVTARFGEFDQVVFTMTADIR